MQVLQVEAKGSADCDGQVHEQHRAELLTMFREASTLATPEGLRRIFMTPIFIDQFQVSQLT
jgi:hypothetical protein